MNNDLISRSATLSHINSVVCVGCNNYDGIRCRACTVDDVMRVVDDDVPAVDALPQWISVKDRLPDTNGDYLVRYGFGEESSRTNHYYSVHFFERTCEEPHFYYEGYRGLRITHWMPLPEPPKEK